MTRPMNRSPEEQREDRVLGHMSGFPNREDHMIHRDVGD